MSNTPSFDHTNMSVKGVEHKPLEEVGREDPSKDYPVAGDTKPLTSSQGKSTPWPKGGFKLT